MKRTEIQNAVVNGPLGTVGMALVANLLEKGIETWAICYPGDHRIKNLPAGAKIVELDMREIQKLPEMMAGADAFFHLAWMGTIGPGRNNTLQAEHGRIEGKVTAEEPCFPTTGYGIAKLCAGQMTRLECGQLGIRHVWARILSAYGPGDGPLSVIPSMLDKLLKGEKPSLTKGEQLWDFCFSGDVAEGLYCMAASGRDGRIYPVGSGEVRPLREYFEVIRDAVDPSLPLGIGELPYNENQVMHLQADLTPLTEDTGFKPKVSFEEGIQITLKAYREQLEKQRQ